VSVDGADYMWYDPRCCDALADVRDAGLLLVDGPPRSVSWRARYPALPLLKKHLAHDAVVILDDARRIDERAIARAWGKKYDKTVTHRPGVTGQWVLTPARR
jgi:hypothetical protein